MAAALDVAGVLIPVLLILWLRARRSSAMRLPPGPKKLPVLGNLLDMPTERPWLKFAAWGNQYGRVCRTTGWLVYDVAVQGIWFRYRSLDNPT